MCLSLARQVNKFNFGIIGDLCILLLNITNQWGTHPLHKVEKSVTLPRQSPRFNWYLLPNWRAELHPILRESPVGEQG